MRKWLLSTFIGQFLYWMGVLKNPVSRSGDDPFIRPPSRPGGGLPSG